MWRLSIHRAQRLTSKPHLVPAVAYLRGNSSLALLALAKRRTSAQAPSLICIVPIVMVTAVLFTNDIAATSFGFFGFGVVAMAKIRPPLIAKAIHISNPSPCIHVLRRGVGHCNPAT